jgi:hypothetical protein
VVPSDEVGGCIVCLKLTHCRHTQVLPSLISSSINLDMRSWRLAAAWLAMVCTQITVLAEQFLDNTTEPLSKYYTVRSTSQDHPPIPHRRLTPSPAPPINVPSSQRNHQPTRPSRRLHLPRTRQPNLGWIWHCPGTNAQRSPLPVQGRAAFVYGAMRDSSGVWRWTGLDSGS